MYSCCNCNADKANQSLQVVNIYILLICFSVIVKQADMFIKFMLESVPGTNQYWAIRVMFFAHRNNEAFDGVQTTPNTGLH